MHSKETVARIVLQIAEELNEGLENKIHVQEGEHAQLFGSKGVLDSLGLVSLIAAVEQGIEAELGVSVTLANEQAISLRKSPFRTVGTLVEYTVQQIEEQG